MDANIPQDQNSEELFALVTQPIAREIIIALSAGEADVSSLAERLELDGSAVSRYLSRLRAGEIVTYRQEWRKHIYRLTERVRLKVTDVSEHLEVSMRSGERVTITIVKSTPADPNRHLSSEADDK